MKILAFSDVHTRVQCIEAMAERARAVDLIIGAGDYANQRHGHQPVIDAIARLGPRVMLTHGNGESHEELTEACAPYDHLSAHHGESVTVGGIPFFFIGAAIPVTPFGAWSVDLTEEDASSILQSCPDRAVIVSHSPPLGFCDQTSSGDARGSRAIHDAVVRTQARYVLCGHIHDSWGARAMLGPCDVRNLGPDGIVLDL